MKSQWILNSSFLSFKVKQQSEEERIRAEAERGSSLTGLETIPEQYDEYGQLILSDEQYRKQLARERWIWAFTKIVQVRLKKCENS